MIITSEFFSFNVWEWFLHSSVLERIESDLSKINWLRGVILLNPIVLVPWGRFPLCHTPIRPILTFRVQIPILIVGCVTTWSRGSHQLVSELGSEIRSYPYVIFIFFSVPLSFSVFASFIFLFFVFASFKQKKRFYFILLLHILSTGGKITHTHTHTHIYIQFELILISFAWGFNLKFNSTAETLLLQNHKQITS
jgi:hypothetical protein